MPHAAASDTTLRQLACAFFTALLKIRVEQQVREVRVRLEGLGDLPRKAARMMQPPRHIRRCRRS
jgi:hypothetical protein